ARDHRERRRPDLRPHRDDREGAGRRRLPGRRAPPDPDGPDRRDRRGGEHRRLPVLARRGPDHRARAARRRGVGRLVSFLKEAPPPSSVVSDEVKRTVEEMLTRIERDGLDAVRDYSRRLDGWDPPSFLVGEEEIAAAGEQLEPE